MSDPVRHPDIQSGVFHPGLYAAVVVLGAMFVLAAWGFAGGGPTDALLVVVSGFIFGSATLVTLLWLTRRRHPRDDLGDPMGKTEHHLESFRDWVCRDVDTSTGRLRGSIASIELLLPIAAVAVGMVAFAVVVHFTGHA
jgi:hypothetical protein